jgi:hypothetical protein
MINAIVDRNSQPKIVATAQSDGVITMHAANAIVRPG